MPQYLPWDDNRPFNDGYLYNCLLIKARMEDEDQPHYRVEDLVVVDEVGGWIVECRYPVIVAGLHCRSAGSATAPSAAWTPPCVTSR